jgi:hypothetical protein
VVARQVSSLAEACRAAGRDPATIGRTYLTPSPAEPLASPQSFVDTAGRYAEIGITEIVVHYPVPATALHADPGVFDRLADSALDEIRRIRPAAVN